MGCNKGLARQYKTARHCERSAAIFLTFSPCVIPDPPCHSRPRSGIQKEWWSLRGGRKTDAAIFDIFTACHLLLVIWSFFHRNPAFFDENSLDIPIRLYLQYNHVKKVWAWQEGRIKRCSVDNPASDNV